MKNNIENEKEIKQPIVDYSDEEYEDKKASDDFWDNIISMARDYN